MTVCRLLAVVATLTLFVGCALSGKDARVRVVGHNDQEDEGVKYHNLVCEILEPPELAGCYTCGSTLRSIKGIDGAELEVHLNFTKVEEAKVNRQKPGEVKIYPPPTPGSGDILDSAKRVK